MSSPGPFPVTLIFAFPDPPVFRVNLVIPFCVRSLFVYVKPPLDSLQQALLPHVPPAGMIVLTLMLGKRAIPVPSYTQSRKSPLASGSPKSVFDTALLLVHFQSSLPLAALFRVTVARREDADWHAVCGTGEHAVSADWIA